MSLNRSLKDFVVKKVSIKERVGSQWRTLRHPRNHPIISTKYRLEVTCGNKDGRISWGDEGDYNKVLLQVRTVPKGFKSGNRYRGSSEFEFYTNSSFTQKISGNQKYRTSFTLPEYKPTLSDTMTYLYFMVKPNVPKISFSKLAWSFGIYGAVRRHHWKSRFTR